jgi:hypothetical protein
MQITLPDGRKATVIDQIDDKMVKLKLEDGREVMWPVKKLLEPKKEGEDTIKMVVVPAIDRLKEFKAEKDILINMSDFVDRLTGKELELAVDLFNQSCDDFSKKWGLT